MVEFSVLKLKCGDCGTVFYSGQEDDDWEKCPMSFCKDGYGYEEDEFIYDIEVNKTTGEVTVNIRNKPDDVIRIK